jgi:hypothetical protein
VQVRLPAACHSSERVAAPGYAMPFRSGGAPCCFARFLATCSKSPANWSTPFCSALDIPWIKCSRSSSLVCCGQFQFISSAQREAYMPHNLNTTSEAKLFIVALRQKWPFRFQPWSEVRSKSHFPIPPKRTKKELALENKPCTYHLPRGARKTAIADRTLPVREGRLL